MRIRLEHQTIYHYQQPARAIAQRLRLTPRSHHGQRVVRWRLGFDVDAQLRRGEDVLGNLAHTAFIPGPVSHLTITVSGEVETSDTHGVVRGAVERFSPEVFLRETPLTRADRAIREFAHDAAGAAGADTLERLHALLPAVRRQIAFEPGPTGVDTPATEAFALGRGVCQDHAHLFIACARALGAPARYVSGHLAPPEGAAEQDAAHAWAEAYVPGLGWVGFDATNGVCPTPAYVRVAVGLDYLGAAPVRGARIGGGQERLEVRLQVGQAQHQAQG
jgi:transglutaminase-like putative cysteine protease